MTEGECDPSARATLRRHELRPRKSLGQNFLRDRSYLKRIVTALDLSDRDEVLEIGPGTGVLTRSLIPIARRVVAVELDRHLVAVLRDEDFAANLRVIEGDALQVDPSDIFPGAYKLVGNIPYYITGPVLRHYLELERPPTVLVLMVQREVAERLTAGPGKLSLLAVSVQFYGTPSIVCRVPRRAFHPAPKVDSAIVKIVPREPALPRELTACFFEIVRAGFGTRRKTLTNALSIGLACPSAGTRALLESAGIDGQRRAETLSIEEWTHLARSYCEAR